MSSNVIVNMSSNAPITTPIVVAVITHITEGSKRIVTKYYNQDKLPQVIMDRINGLPHEQNWHALCFGDLKSASGGLLLERKRLLGLAELDEDFAQVVPHTNRCIGLVRQYLAPVIEYKPRVIKMVNTYNFGTPVDVYYRESELPLGLLENIRSEMAQTDCSEDMQHLLYKDVADSHSGMAIRCKQLAAAQLGHVIHFGGKPRNFEVVKTLNFGDGCYAEEGEAE